MDGTGAAKPSYSFSNDISGRFFVWLVDSNRLDLSAVVEPIVAKSPDAEKCVKRLGKELRQFVEEKCPIWDVPGAMGDLGSATSRYTVWFRPSPPKKIQFKEVAQAVLTLLGKLPPAATL